MPIQAFPVNCDGGLVLDRSVFSMQPGEALTLENFEPAISGGYAKIKGFSKFDTNEVSGTGGVLGLAFYGNNKVVAARAAYVQHSTGSGWTSIATNRTSAGRYSFTNYDWDGTENIAMADGVNDAAYWDGTTYTLINAATAGTKPTAPDVVQEFKGHLFFGGMSNAPHTVKFTSPFSENDFSAASGAGEISFGEDVISLRPFRDSLIIFCKNSIHRLVGSSSADFAIQPIAKNIGCLSHFSVQEIGGDLIFLAPDGIRTVAGTSKIADTELGTVSKQVQKRLNSLSQDQLSNVSSHVIRNKSQYRVYYPTTAQGESAAKGLIAVLKRDITSGQVGWQYADIGGIKPMISASGYISDVEKVIHGDYDGGYIYLQESGDDFDGTNMSCTYRSTDYNMGDVGVRKNMQRILLNIEPTGTIQDADLTLAYDYDDLTAATPSAYDLTDSPSSSIYGSAIYGASFAATYGGGIVTPLYRQSVEGSGFSVALKFTDSSDNPTYTIKGFSLEFTPGGRM